MQAVWKEERDVRFSRTRGDRSVCVHRIDEKLQVGVFETGVGEGRALVPVSVSFHITPSVMFCPLFSAGRCRQIIGVPRLLNVSYHLVNDGID